MTRPDLGLVPRPGPCAHGVTGGSHCSMCAAEETRGQRAIELSAIARRETPDRSVDHG